MHLFTQKMQNIVIFLLKLLYIFDVDIYSLCSTGITSH